MKKQNKKIVSRVSGTLAIIHILAIAIMFMVPRETIIKIAENGVYPPFIGSYVEKLHIAQHEYESYQMKVQNEDDDEFDFFIPFDEWDLEYEVEAAERKIVSMMFTDFLIMFIIFGIVYLALCNDD